jgi:hypothetical protein
MNQISSFPFSIRFAWPRMRFAFRIRWFQPALMALGLATGMVLGLALDRYSPEDAIAEEVPAAMTAVPYVSSDTSVPAADGVKFPDPEPLIPTF